MDYLSNDKLNSINYPLIKPACWVMIGGFFMLKNECIYEVPLMKQEFVDIINRLQVATELMDKLSEEYLKWFSYRTITCVLRGK